MEVDSLIVMKATSDAAIVETVQDQDREQDQDDTTIRPLRANSNSYWRRSHLLSHTGTHTVYYASTVQ